MPNEHQPNTEDRKKPLRGVIYLREPEHHFLNAMGAEPPLDLQRELCRGTAHALQAEIVAELVDTKSDREERPGLREALETVCEQRLDFLIVWSLDRLADDYEQLVKVAWKLGRAGTIPVPAEIAYRTVPQTSPE